MLPFSGRLINQILSFSNRSRVARYYRSDGPRLGLEIFSSRKPRLESRLYPSISRYTDNTHHHVDNDKNRRARRLGGGHTKVRLLIFFIFHISNKDYRHAMVRRVSLLALISFWAAPSLVSSFTPFQHQEEISSPRLHPFRRQQERGIPSCALIHAVSRRRSPPLIRVRFNTRESLPAPSFMPFQHQQEGISLLPPPSRPF